VAFPVNLNFNLGALPMIAGSARKLRARIIGGGGALSTD